MPVFGNMVLTSREAEVSDDGVEIQLSGRGELCNVDDIPTAINDDLIATIDGGDGGEHPRLPTIVEIAGINSSDSYTDENIQPLSPHKRSIDNFIISQQRHKLQKAEQRNDYETKQLSAQLSLTQQYTDEIIAMRKEQSKLEKKLLLQRRELKHRNEQLKKELTQLDIEAANISKSEAEVIKLRGQYRTELQLLEKEHLRLIASATSSELALGSPRNIDNKGEDTSLLPRVIDISKSALQSFMSPFHDDELVTSVQKNGSR